jgi:hypothetical protein
MILLRSREYSSSDRLECIFKMVNNYSMYLYLMIVLNKQIRSVFHLYVSEKNIHFKGNNIKKPIYKGRFGFMVFNATFNSISVISWRPVLLVEETGVPSKRHRTTSSSPDIKTYLHI